MHQFTSRKINKVLNRTMNFFVVVFFLVIIQHNYLGNDKSDLLFYFNLNADSTDFTQNSNMITPNCFKCQILALLGCMC